MADILCFARRRKVLNTDQTAMEILRSVIPEEGDPEQAPLPGPSCLLGIWLSLKGNPEEIEHIAEKVSLIISAIKTTPISNNKKAQALDTISEWDDAQIVRFIIEADPKMIRTKPALFSAALQKLFSNIMQGS